jgi:hypothetical protein
MKRARVVRKGSLYEHAMAVARRQSETAAPAYDALAVQLLALGSVSLQALIEDVLSLASELKSQERSSEEAWRLVETALRPHVGRLIAQVFRATTEDPYIEGSMARRASRRHGVLSGEARGARKAAFIEWAKRELLRDREVRMNDLARRYAALPQNSLPAQTLRRYLTEAKLAQWQPARVAAEPPA